mmetsp:Transcript_16622/g.35917  ORF Transcript_16622/g.35917 Transcript_16622/m.35917 type:complete len:661 (+) Transcript_16622:84-2066(+)
MPYRIAIGSCSHPLLPQPLWKIIRARQPTAFIWGGDAVYSDRFNGRNWTAVGLHRVHDDESNATSKNDGGWRLTFPPPSIHLDATPDIIRHWYEEQWGVEDYRRFVEGWYDAENSTQLTRPLIYGIIDDHDYGQNNGDLTYQYKQESNLAFVDFLYSGVADENQCGERDVCEASQDESDENPSKDMEEENNPKIMHSSRTKSKIKSSDPMYQRAIDGKGVYGVQLFDFSRTREGSSSPSSSQMLRGGGYWVPDEDAKIDPDITGGTNTEDVNYSTTHSVAIFALDVRSNKTPWPKGKQTITTTTAKDDIRSNSTSINAPMLDFLGQHQWEWFQSALANSRATVNIIVSGLQIHPERFPNDGNVVEEWSKFPEARQMLYDMILNSGVRSPLLVSGDVHMAQIMRKDCIPSSAIMNGSSFKSSPQTRPLIEITTSGMTHSWGTSFSSQPKNHRMPLKLYTYFVSRVFMTVCHFVCPWNDIVIRTVEDVNREADERAARQDEDNEKHLLSGGRTGKQYYLGLNFAELEFDFHDEEDGGNSGGAVTARIFGKQENEPPKLEMRWSFDQLSGGSDLPGITAKLHDFLTLGNRYNAPLEHEWICAPHRGLASIYHEYAANIITFFNICFLFFLPHGIFLLLLIQARRKWSQRKDTSRPNENIVHSN